MAEKELITEADAPLEVAGFALPKQLFESLTITESKNNSFVIRLPATILDVENLNKRVYPTHLMRRAIEKVQPAIKAGKLLCTANEHPNTPKPIPIMSSHRISEAWIEKIGGQSLLMNEWTVFETLAGKDLRAVFEGGGAPGVSIRGWGRSDEKDTNQGVMKEYDYLGTDAVSEPSAQLYAGTNIPNCELVECAGFSLSEITERLKKGNFSNPDTTLKDIVENLYQLSERSLTIIESVFISYGLDLSNPHLVEELESMNDDDEKEILGMLDTVGILETATKEYCESVVGEIIPNFKNVEFTFATADAADIAADALLQQGFIPTRSRSSRLTLLVRKIADNVVSRLAKFLKKVMKLKFKQDIFESDGNVSENIMNIAVNVATGLLRSGEEEKDVRDIIVSRFPLLKPDDVMTTALLAAGNKVQPASTADDDRLKVDNPKGLTPDSVQVECITEAEISVKLVSSKLFDESKFARSAMVARHLLTFDDKNDAKKALRVLNKTSKFINAEKTQGETSVLVVDLSSNGQNVNKSKKFIQKILQDSGITVESIESAESELAQVNKTAEFIGSKPLVRHTFKFSDNKEAKLAAKTFDKAFGLLSSEISPGTISVIDSSSSGNNVTKSKALVLSVLKRTKIEVESLESEEMAKSNYIFEGRTRTLTRYGIKNDGNVFIPTTDTTETLKSGIYTVSCNMSGVYFEVKELNSDKLLDFTDPRLQEIIDEVAKFWTLADNFKQLEFTHKRGVLLHGSPGTGKTCLIRKIVEQAVTDGNVVFYPESIGNLIAGLKQFKEVEPDRQCLAILEDVDAYAYSERSLLELMDGDDQLDGVLILATTNYIERLPPRVIRSGRFDTKIEVRNPPAAGRKAYFMTKIPGVNEAGIESIVKATSDFSFGQLRDLVVQAFAYKRDLGKSIERVRNQFNESKLSTHFITTENKNLVSEDISITGGGVTRRLVVVNLIDSNVTMYRVQNALSKVLPCNLIEIFGCKTVGVWVDSETNDCTLFVQTILEKSGIYLEGDAFSTDEDITLDPEQPVMAAANEAEIKIKKVSDKGVELVVSKLNTVELMRLSLSDLSEQPGVSFDKSKGIMNLRSRGTPQTAKTAVQNLLKRFKIKSNIKEANVKNLGLKAVRITPINKIEFDAARKVIAKTFGKSNVITIHGGGTAIDVAMGSSDDSTDELKRNIIKALATAGISEANLQDVTLDIKDSLENRVSLVPFLEYTTEATTAEHNDHTHEYDPNNSGFTSEAGNPKHKHPYRKGGAITGPADKDPNKHFHKLPTVIKSEDGKVSEIEKTKPAVGGVGFRVRVKLDSEKEARIATKALLKKTPSTFHTGADLDEVETFISNTTKDIGVLRKEKDAVNFVKSQLKKAGIKVENIMDITEAVKFALTITRGDDILHRLKGTFTSKKQADLARDSLKKAGFIIPSPLNDQKVVVVDVAAIGKNKDKKQAVKSANAALNPMGNESLCTEGKIKRAKVIKGIAYNIEFDNKIQAKTAVNALNKRFIDGGAEVTGGGKNVNFNHITGDSFDKSRKEVTSVLDQAGLDLESLDILESREFTDGEIGMATAKMKSTKIKNEDLEISDEVKIKATGDLASVLGIDGDKITVDVGGDTQVVSRSEIEPVKHEGFSPGVQKAIGTDEDPKARQAGDDSAADDGNGEEARTKAMASTSDKGKPPTKPLGNSAFNKPGEDKPSTTAATMKSIDNGKELARTKKMKATADKGTSATTNIGAVKNTFSFGAALPASKESINYEGKITSSAPIKATKHTITFSDEKEVKPALKALKKSSALDAEIFGRNQILVRHTFGSAAGDSSKSATFVKGLLDKAGISMESFELEIIESQLTDGDKDAMAGDNNWKVIPPAGEGNPSYHDSKDVADTVAKKIEGSEVIDLSTLDETFDESIIEKIELAQEIDKIYYEDSDTFVQRQISDVLAHALQYENSDPDDDDDEDPDNPKKKKKDDDDEEELDDNVKTSKKAKKTESVYNTPGAVVCALSNTEYLTTTLCQKNLQTGGTFQDYLETVVSSHDQVAGMRIVMNYEQSLNDLNLTPDQLKTELEDLDSAKNIVFGQAIATEYTENAGTRTEAASDINNRMALNTIEAGRLLDEIRVKLPMTEGFRVKLIEVADYVRSLEKVVDASNSVISTQETELLKVMDLHNAGSETKADTIEEAIQGLADAQGAIEGLQASYEESTVLAAEQMQTIEEIRKYVKSKFTKMERDLDLRNKFITDLRSRIKLTKPIPASTVRVDTKVRQEVSALIARNTHLEQFRTELETLATSKEHAHSLARKYSNIPETQKSRSGKILGTEKVRAKSRVSDIMRNLPGDFI